MPKWVGFRPASLCKKSWSALDIGLNLKAKAILKDCMTRFRNAAVRQYFVLRHYAVGNIIMCHPGKICEILYFFRRVLAHFEILKLIFVNDFVVRQYLKARRRAGKEKGGEREREKEREGWEGEWRSPYGE